MDALAILSIVIAIDKQQFFVEFFNYFQIWQLQFEYFKSSTFSSYFVCLFIHFVFSCQDLPSNITPCYVLGIIQKPLMRRDEPRWFCNIQSYNCRLGFIKFQIKFSLKNQQNKISNFMENWSVLLLFLESLQRVGLHGGDFMIFIPRVWGRY